MKLTIIFLTAAVMHVYATGHSQTVSLNGKNISLKQVLLEIEQQTGFVVFGNVDVLKKAKPVTVSATNMPLRNFLYLILSGQDLNYRITDNTITLSAMSGERRSGLTRLYSSAPEVPVAFPVFGKVTDFQGRELVGVSIRVRDGEIGTSTDINGNFQLKNVPQNAVILISSVGYESLEFPVADLIEGKNRGRNLQTVFSPENGLALTVRLEQKEVVLDTTTVSFVNTGYQNLPKERVTGAFSVVPREVMNARLQTNILDRIEGIVPGLFMNNGTINIRGISTLYGNQTPLFVVDGFPYEGNIASLNPADIVNITVMKDAAAASIYGTRAANGVITITTRLGSAGKTSVNYNSSLFLTPRPDPSYLNLLNSKEMVDLQVELFNMKHPSANATLLRGSLPAAIEALYQHESGDINGEELNSILEQLRNQNNTEQIREYLFRPQIKHQHSFSVAGGTNLHRYNLAVNYIGTQRSSRENDASDINVNFRNQLSVFKWLQADLGVATSFSNSDYAPAYVGDYFRGTMPYQMLKDENGNNVPWNFFKSKSEIERLKSIGLHDESFNPLSEMGTGYGRNRSNYTRLQGGFTAKIIPGLSFDLKYQTENGDGYSKTVYYKNSYFVKTRVNNAATLQSGDLIKNVPDGGQIFDTRSDSRSYTMRAQLNFDRQIADDHRLTSVIGSERRKVSVSSTSTHHMGYDDNNLKFVTINPLLLADLKGTQSLSSTYNYRESDYNYYRYTEDRYVSFYGNFAYSYKSRYNLTGSVRIDDSNLFGSDPRYRHLPLWSAGASWRITGEKFMQDLYWLDNLTLRTTYGLNGNVAKNVGPFLQATTSYNPNTEAMATTLLYPPNKSLRWEKTAVTNLGIDFSLMKNRISGSIDLYYRKSSDLLGDRETDPTNAFQTALINYGGLTNKGIEFGLNTQNIRSKNFGWTTRATFSYNKNEMTRISTQYNSVYGYTQGTGIEKTGYPMSSIFNFRWAGLDPTNGTVLVYDKDGKVVKNYDDQGALIAGMTDIDGLVYSGTLRPKYTAGLTNTFAYKKITLNIFIIGNGGHVFRDATPQLLNNSNFDRNIDRRSMNFWRKPGDEKIPGTMPAPDLNGGGDSYFSSIWYAADINTLKADFFKIRDIALSYDFASLLFNARSISSAILSFQVQNPYKWLRNKQGLDPEAYAASSIYSERTMPVTPCYMFGLNVSF